MALCYFAVSRFGLNVCFSFKHEDGRVLLKLTSTKRTVRLQTSSPVSCVFDIIFLVTLQLFGFLKYHTFIDCRTGGGTIETHVVNRIMEPLAKRYLLSWLFVASSLQVTSLHFAEATYICTAYLNVSFIDSVNNETVWRQEESGLYGQQSPKVTVMGDVYLPDPIYSCESNTFYDVPSGSKGWIALIQRGQLCSFSEKINVAASKGAIAAVIFNDLGTDNRVIQMSHPGM